MSQFQHNNNNNNQSHQQQQQDPNHQTYSHRHGESMILLLRKINNAIKYIVVFIVFIICVTRTQPGNSDVGVLPAYYLITSLLLAAVVKILKRIFKQPRPEPEQCPYHHPAKYGKKNEQYLASQNSKPTNIVTTSSSSNENGDDYKNDDDENDEYNNDDDHGMPSSHSALLGYFSWVAVFAIFSHDAFGLFTRALSGLIGVFLPIAQIFMDSSAVLGLMTSNQKSKFDTLADGHSRGSESLSFLLIVIIGSMTILSLGVFGAFLRVINGDHTVAQAMAGYVLGFLWACGSVVAQNKVFLVNEQSVEIQHAWMWSGIVIGSIGGVIILRNKRKKKMK